MSVVQTGTVAEYEDEFIGKANPLGKVDGPMMLGSFLKGLKEDVRREL